jgi:hypothetical protein
MTPRTPSCSLGFIRVALVLDDCGVGNVLVCGQLGFASACLFDEGLQDGVLGVMSVHVN